MLYERGIGMGVDRVARRSLVALLIGGMALALGCGGTRTVVVQQGAPPATSELLIRNRSAVQICFVRFSPTSDPNWGPDRLGAQEIITPGQDRGWRVPADTYDFQLIDCGQRVLMERRGEPIGSNQRRTVTFRVPE